MADGKLEPRVGKPKLSMWGELGFRDIIYQKSGIRNYLRINGSAQTAVHSHGSIRALRPTKAHENGEKVTRLSSTTLSSVAKR
jgi:hypothetical protein